MATDIKNDAGLSTNLISYWELEEASGTRVDSHGSFDLTDNNTVGSAAGKINDAADFIRANNEYLSNNTVMSSVANAWSFSSWFNFPNIGAANQTVWTARPVSGAINILQIETYVDPGPTGNVRFIGFNSSGVYRKDYRFNGLTADTWHHVVITWDGSVLNFYKNGSTAGVTKTTDSVFVTSATTRQFRVGAETATGNIADGLIDEIGIWTRALTAAEVLDLYNGGAGIPYDAGGGGSPTPRNLLMMGVGM